MRKNKRMHGHKIVTWYDRQTRSWVTQLKDRIGNQVGEAQYNGSKTGARASERELLKKLQACYRENEW